MCCYRTYLPSSGCLNCDSLKYYLPLVLLLHTSESESLISKESGAHSLGAHLSIAGGLLDTIAVGLLVLVVVSVVL